MRSVASFSYEVLYKWQMKHRRNSVLQQKENLAGNRLNVFLLNNDATDRIVNKFNELKLCWDEV